MSGPKNMKMYLDERIVREREAGATTIAAYMEVRAEEVWFVRDLADPEAEEATFIKLFPVEGVVFADEVRRLIEPDADLIFAYPVVLHFRGDAIHVELDKSRFGWVEVQ